MDGPPSTDDPVAQFAKLPLPERIAHKNWKVREAAYRELTDKFRLAAEDAKIYSDFLSALGKIVRDANAPAQLAGFDSVSKYADTAPPQLVRRVAADVAKGIVEKGLAGRPQNKGKAVEAFLMFVGADAGDLAVEALASVGFKHRTPKVVAAAVDAVTQALDTYGTAAVPVKAIASKLPPLFGHSQEIVRNAAKALVIELHRWVGDGVKAVVKGAKEVTIKEVEAAFAKHAGQGKPQPKKRTRAMEKRVREGGGDDDESDGDDGFGGGEMEEDEMDVAEEINLLEKLAKTKIEIDEDVTKDWYTAVDSKKWKARKDALDAAVNIIGEARLTPANHQEIIVRLRKIIAKDANVNVVASAANLLRAMCNGLKKNFPPGAAKALTVDLFGRLKEKNRILVDPVCAALDAVHAKKCIRIVELLEEISTAAKHKTPKARSELLLWLGRSIRDGTPGADLKGVPLKCFGTLFLKGSDDSAPEVRDAALAGLASLQKVVGERNVLPYMEKLDKKRKDKVAAIAAELPEPKKLTATKQTAAAGKPRIAASSKDRTRTSTRSAKAKADSASPSSVSPRKAASPAKRAKPSKPAKPKPYESDDEGEISQSPEDALDLAAERFEEFEKEQWSGKSFKARVAMVTMVNDSLREKETFADEDVSLALGLLSCQPGLADSNFMALKPKLELFGMVAAKCAAPLPRKTLRPLLLHAAEKFGDIKSSKMVAGIMMSYAEATSPRYLFEILTHAVLETKNNRAVIAILKFAAALVEDFGIPAVPEKTVATVAAATMGNAAPAARNAAAALACKAASRVNAEDFRKKLVELNTTEEALELFDSELQKYGREPDPPSRKKRFGPPALGKIAPDEEIEKVSSPSRVTEEIVGSESSHEHAHTTDTEAAPEEKRRLAERVSLAHEFAPGSRIFLDLKNSNWKKRQDALAAVSVIIEGGGDFIKPEVGPEIIVALRARLSDSNRNLAVAAYDVVSRLIRSMGPGGVVHLKTLAPTVLGQGCVDIKKSVREAATKVLFSWFDMLGLAPLIPFCHLPLASLNSGFRKEFLEWLVPRLQGEVGAYNSGAEDLSLLVDTSFACLRDRTAEVRHLADLMLEQVINSVGIGAVDSKLVTMTKAARNQIEPVLDKYRAVAPKSTGAAGLPPIRVSNVPTPRSGRERPRSMALPRTPVSRRGFGAGDDVSTPVGTGSRRPRPASARMSPMVSSLGGFDQPPHDDVPLLKQNDGREVRARRFLNKRRRFIEELNEADPSGDMQPLISEDIEDLVEDLNECCSPSLCAKLTAPANRFRMHVEAVEAVRSHLESNPETLIFGADVLLRWSACRIEDSRTPPTVLVKLASFVSNICEILMSSRTKLREYEACAVLPPVAEKCGSNRESIRQAMRSCLLSIGDVVEDDVLLVLLTSCLRYPVSPRAHTEVSNEICRLIDKRCSSGAGMPTGVLPTIGKVAGGEDEGAGRAAAVCLDRAHEYFGDDLWNLVGDLANKEATLLDDRLNEVNGGAKEELRTSPKGDVHLLTSAHSDRGIVLENPAPRPASAMPNDIRNEDFRLSVAPAPPSSVMTSISDSLNTATPRKTHVETQNAIPETPALPVRHRHVLDPSENEDIASEILGRLRSGDRDLQLSGLASIFDDLKNDGTLLKYNGSSDLLLQLVKCFTETLTRLEQGQAVEDDPAVLKSFLKGVIRFAREPELLRRLDQASVERLLADALNAMIPQTVAGVEDWDQVRRGVNLMIVKVLESCDQNLLYTAMINLLLENIKAIQRSGSRNMSTALAKSSICIKSIAKVTKRGFTDCRVNALLRDIHLFLMANPVRRDGTSSAEDQTFAMRLLKTVVNAIIDEMGIGIRTHLDLIPQPDKSQLVHYVDMTLSDRERIEGGSERDTNAVLEDRHREAELSVTGCLSRIEIGSNSDAALQQLNSVLQWCPDVDLESHLARYSDELRSFVKAGLQKLSSKDSQRSLVSAPSALSPVSSSEGSRREDSASLEQSQTPSTGSGSSGTAVHSAGQVYLKRLHEIQLRYGLQTGIKAAARGAAGTEKENGAVEKIPSVDEVRGKASTLRERMARIRELQSASKE